MNNSQRKSLPKNSKPETSQALNAFAKALIVDLTWSMAGLYKARKSTPQTQQPPHPES